ncbi:MAG: DUF1990 family protein [Bacteroidetes bacterium]|nr:DUF1990 family protein [Bacteroidota bacterium]
MKIFLTDQKHNLPKLLEGLKEKSVRAYDINRMTEKVSIININQAPSDYKFLFDYKIFPENIMTFLTEWKLDNREMNIGDTIVQQIYLPPTRLFSQKVIFGVRINELIDEPGIRGFSYETLEGHIEKGVSTFTLEQKDGETLFKIRTFSTPGNMFIKIMAPVFSVPYQTFCTTRALKYVKRQIEN